MGNESRIMPMKDIRLSGCPFRFSMLALSVALAALFTLRASPPVRAEGPPGGPGDFRPDPPSVKQELGYLSARLVHRLRLPEAEAKALRSALLEFLGTRNRMGRERIMLAMALRRSLELGRTERMEARLERIRSLRGRQRKALAEAEEALCSRLSGKTVEAKLVLLGLLFRDDVRPPGSEILTAPRSELEDLPGTLGLSGKPADEMKARIHAFQRIRSGLREKETALLRALWKSVVSGENQAVVEQLERAKAFRSEMRASLDAGEGSFLQGLSPELKAKLVMERVVLRPFPVLRIRKPDPPERVWPMMVRFDEDGDRILSNEERGRARVFAKEHQNPRISRIRRMRTGETSAPVRETSCDPEAGLYQDDCLRTLFLTFGQKDWYEELVDFYRTGVEVPADLVVHGKTYPSVGVRFRGNSSFMMGRRSDKKSFNLSVDFRNPRQSLLGYSTLNLHNAASDPSLMRTVLYRRICREFLPSARANFVKLVINGESWGVFPNVQQYGGDFFQEHFGTRGGAWWKVSPGRDPAKALRYAGPDLDAYRRAIECKRGGSDEDWKALRRLCEILERSPDERLEQELGQVFKVDRALWLIALENAFIDSDGYISRGSDYMLYRDPGGRFHMLPYDDNETFIWAGGGGPNQWPAGTTRQLSPLGHEASRNRPVIRRLLGIPHLRARYLAHLRTLVERWLDWERIGPVASAYHRLIDEEVRADTHSAFPYGAFKASLDRGGTGERERPRGFGPMRGHGPSPSFKTFVTERRKHLLAHPALERPGPRILAVELVRTGEGEQGATALAHHPITIRATLGEEPPAQAVFLHYSPGPMYGFRRVPMFDDGAHRDGARSDRVFAGSIPPHCAGIRVRYYIEARTALRGGAASFHPQGAEYRTHSFLVTPSEAQSPIVINEVVSRNDGSFRDSEGDAGDWLELYNRTEKEVDLSGMHLTDCRFRLRKWTFPGGVKIPAGGHLIVWADGDGSGKPGLHASFRLARGGETLLLVDRDDRGCGVLDALTYDRLKRGQAFGRSPDGGSNLKKMAATPGRAN
jgi:hypothetical protein